MLQSAASVGSTYSAPKRLAAPVSTTTKDNRNFLAKVYDALLNVPTPAAAGVSIPSRSKNPLAQTVEPVRVAARRAVGDFTAIPGVGKPSPSPTAADFRAGNYVGPVMDYANLALTVAPTAVKGIRSRNIYGLHSSPESGLNVIKPRVANQMQRTAEDAVQGSSYMWDAKSPAVAKGDVLQNPQMRLAIKPDLMDAEDIVPNTLYLTKAPRRKTLIDANVPDSYSIRVLGPQKVVAKLPIEQEALMAALKSYGINPRSQLAQKLIQKMRASSPRSLKSVAARPNDLAENRLRAAITRVNESNSPPGKAQWGRLHGMNLDPDAPLEELLKDPTVSDVFRKFLQLTYVK